MHKERGFFKRLRLFWWLLLSFVVVLMVIVAGISVSVTATVGKIQTDLAQYGSPQTLLWANRLGAFYANHGGWQGVVAFVSSYPTGEGWGPWDQSWDLPYALANVNGVIIASSDPSRVGDTLKTKERAAAQAIAEDGETVGYLVMPFAVAGQGDGVLFRVVSRSDLLRVALVRLALMEAIVIGSTLVIGAVLFHRASKPITALTEATRAIAEGDLAIRVDEAYPGEIGELATSFNTMAEALQRSNELRRNMTADVAHELRTPLSVIRGRLEGILDGVYPATSEQLAPVLEETELLTRLVEDLRVLALAEARQLSLDLRPTNIVDLLSDLQVNFRPLAGDKGITLVLDLPESLPPVLADWQRVSQVGANLITNAIRHTPEGGVVTLSAVKADQDVVVTISDTGVGIPPDDLPFVFERFWRGERSRSRESGGSGLGLAIARELVRLHGGTLHATSTPGQGSTFTFTLPVNKV